MPATPSKNLLTGKWGPLPVWVWGAIGVAAAYLYSRHKAGQASAATSTVSAAAQPSTTTPDFVIENNLPAGGWGAPSHPVTTTPAPPPTITPPSTTPSPPISGLPVTAPPPTSPVKPVTNPPAPVPAKKAAIQYKVVSGDNLTKIAQRYHTTAAALYAYNTTPGVRPAATIAELKQRGPNLIFPGETILIPQ